MKSSVLLLLVVLTLTHTSCFRRWRMNDRQIRQYYADRPVKPRFHTFKSDSLKLFCASFGPDTLPPLLLIHGAPGAWYGYLRTLDDSLLLRRFNIIAIDRPGYGGSRLRGQRHTSSITHQARWVARALELNRSGKPAVVLGRSFGAPIAARLAMLYPERVRHVLLVAPPIDPVREKFWWFSRLGRFPLVQLFLPRQLNRATDEKYAHVKELEQLLPLWPSLRVPTTVIQGGKDWIVDPANLDFARKVLTGKPAEFIYVPEGGHMLTESHPDLVRRLLLRALLDPAAELRSSAATDASPQSH